MALDAFPNRAIQRSFARILLLLVNAFVVFELIGNTHRTSVVRVLWTTSAALRQEVLALQYRVLCLFHSELFTAYFAFSLCVCGF